ISGLRPLAAVIARSLIAAAPKFGDDWNYGNAIHQANLALGEIALAQGDVPRACERLLAAGATPGSPQLDSFGPNMRLALRLLQRGEQHAVIEYLERCRKFWKMERGLIDRWKAEVEAGQTPQFGANLLY